MAPTDEVKCLNCGQECYRDELIYIKTHSQTEYDPEEGELLTPCCHSVDWEDVEPVEEEEED